MSRIDDFDPSLALPPPTLNIAATGPRTIEVAARWADGISFSVGADIERLRNAIGLAHEACAKVGRDPASLTLGCYVQVAVTDDADASAREAIRGLVVTHARFSGFEARPVGDVAAADHERYRKAVETMESVYRDHTRRRRAHRGRQAGRDRLLSALGRRRRADRRLRDRRAGRLLRGAAAGDRRARDRADLHRHPSGRRRPRRAERRADRARGPGGGSAMTALTGREVQLVAFPRGEVRESDFEVVEAAGRRRRSRPGARPQHVDVCRSRASPAAARARARGVLRRLPAPGADGRDHDDRRGGRVPGRRVRRGRHRLARIRLAGLRGRHRR